MARQVSPDYTKKSGRVGNQIFANLGKGVVGTRGVNTTQAPLKFEQKVNASILATLASEVKFLNRTFRVSFPPDSQGIKGANRFVSLNRLNEEATTTTKNEPDTPLDPKKKAPKEFTTVIHWNKVKVAEGELWDPVVEVTKQVMELKDIIEEKRKQLGKKAVKDDGTPVEIKAKEGEMYALAFYQEPFTFEGAYAYADDIFYALVYEPDKHFCLFSPLRERGKQGSTTLAVPAIIPVEKLHVYIFATTKNGKNTSNTVYTTVTQP